MVLPDPRTDGGSAPDRAMPPSDCARACGSRGGTACLGRIVRGLADHVLDRDRRPGLDLPSVHRQRTDGSSGRPPPGRARTPTAQPVEAELAESLDTVLRIIGRLAASHDRAELVRMIVDETKRALRADAATIRLLRDDHLELAAWAGLPDAVAEATALDRLRCRAHRRGHRMPGT